MFHIISWKKRKFNIEKVHMIMNDIMMTNKKKMRKKSFNKN